MVFIPFKKMQERVDVDLAESDSALFWALMYYGEFVTKLTVAALVSAVTEERDRHRYRLTHRLVRAASIGDWNKTLDDLLTGPASQYIDNLAREYKRQLTQRVVGTQWQHQAAALLHNCLDELDIEAEVLPTKVPARRWFSDFVQLRNKTRGHGATKGSLCARVCEHLQESINLLISNLALFQQPWAYLHRNLSGKYRVTHLGGDRAPFSPLKRQTDVSICDGVYVYFSELRKVELLASDLFCLS